jgi:hypothetical protein
MLYWKYKVLMPDMKRIFYILLLMINIGVFAQEKQHITVETRGVGVSPDAALKDALSQAVHQASGTLVDAKTIVKNEEIMEDRILAASDGFIQSYEKYGEARKNRQGLWTIRIRASVVMNPLKQKLIESRVVLIPSGRCDRENIQQLTSIPEGKIRLAVNISKGKYRK